MWMKIKIVITNYQIYISDFIMKHVLEKQPVTSPWKPRVLWNTEYTYTVLTIITSNFNSKSTTTNTKRKMAKARPGILELLLPPTATQLGFQVINKFMFYTN